MWSEHDVAHIKILMRMKCAKRTYPWFAVIVYSYDIINIILEFFIIIIIYYGEWGLYLNGVCKQL